MSKPFTLSPEMAARSVHKMERGKASLLASTSRRLKYRPPTKDNPLIISASELSSFLRCRVQHHWSYQCRLIPQSARIPLLIGSLGHRIQEDWYKLPFKQRTVRRMEKMARRHVKVADMEALPTEHKDLLIDMTSNYARWAMDPNEDNSDAVVGLRECWPEEEFSYPLTEDKTIIVRGKLDNRFFPSAYKKTVATLESKFKKAIKYDDVENRIQNTVYLWVLRQKFPKMKRYQVMYQILRKQMRTPRVKAALIWRDIIEREDDQIDQWAIDAQRQAMDLLDGAVYPNPMDSCSWSCDFKIPCLMRGNASDLKHVLRSEFTRKEERK